MLCLYQHLYNKIQDTSIKAIAITNAAAEEVEYQKSDQHHAHFVTGDLVLVCDF